MAMEYAEALPLLGFCRSLPACPASAAVHHVCRTGVSKQWSALLTLSKSRIGHRCGMRKRLREAHWAAFVLRAETEHKAQFFCELHCEGKLDSTPCPNSAQIDLWHAAHAAVIAADCRHWELQVVHGWQ